jgi:colanic acid biosynthesis glycosyl transferase WcaI
LTQGHRFNALLNVADIHVLPQRRDASDLVMPSKLGPMLAVGKPVVATVPHHSQIAHLIRGAGIIVPPEDADALAGALHELAGNPQWRLDLGQIALQIAHKHYETDGILPVMESRLIDLIGMTRQRSSTKRTA